jgi:sugar-specific transcriptional regulator TrmB
MLEKLQKLGLSKKESLVYLELVKSGNSGANEIAKKISTQRTVVYNLLQQLIEKGFVNFVKREGKRIYSISNPESLLSEIKEREVVAEKLIVEINEMKKNEDVERKVEVFEGVSSMRNLFDEIKDAKELRVLNATGKIFDNLKYSSEHIIEHMKENSKVWNIGVPSMKNTKLASFGFRTKYLPKGAENLATTFIFEGKVITQVLRDKPFLIRIENKDIFEGYKKDFDVFWKLL